MKLYYAPAACSLSPHIVLREVGLAFDMTRVDLATGKTETGTDFATVNPNGYVPVLVLDDGSLLMEGPAIVQYLADRVPEKKLAPPNGTLERYRLQAMLNFIATELHKAFGALFNPAAGDDWKKAARTQIGARLASVQDQLKGPFRSAINSRWRTPTCSPCSAGASTATSISPNGRNWPSTPGASPNGRRCRPR